MTGAPLWGLPPEVDGRTNLVMATDEAYLDALATDPLAFDTAAAEPNLWRALTNAGARVRRDLPSVDLPVLLINGEYDCFAAPSRAATFAHHLQNAHAIRIRGGYHDIPNDAAHRHVTGLIGEAALLWCAAPPLVGK
jgi:pimeloyl-ACP methyl ester carboxylesterase